MDHSNWRKTQNTAASRQLPQSLLKAHPQQTKLLTGFVLSVLLLCITEILYKIPYRHAAALDPQVFSVKLPAIDDRIPVVPVFFFGYIWSYAYWFFSPFFILQTGKEKIRVFLITYVVTLIFCSLILYFFPTKIDRVAEGLWDPSLSGFFWRLLHICYNVDGGNVSYNLLPSMHCANCVIFYQALRDDKIPYRFQMAALFSTVLVIISTLLTKQHFFLDVVTGILIPIIIRSMVVRIDLPLQTKVSREAPDEK